MGAIEAGQSLAQSERAWEWDEVRAQVNNEAGTASVVARLKDALARRRYFSGLIRDVEKAL